jgi:hypothetical protein
MPLRFVEDHMKPLGIACALLLASARAAYPAAGGLNLGWNDCGGNPAAIDVVFACSSDSRTFTLIGSFVAPSEVTAASGIVAILDLQAASIGYPAWWALAPGLCRAGSLSATFDFRNGPYSCVDYWQGGASGSISMAWPAGNRTRIRVDAALPAGSPLITSIPEGTEVYAFGAIIDAAKTTGPNACTGCQTGAVVCLNSITITQPADAGVNRFISQPAARGFAIWQGGPPYDASIVCYPGDPVRSTTWGSIKSLYR